jgi:hypothetical protein
MAILSEEIGMECLENAYLANDVTGSKMGSRDLRNWIPWSEVSLYSFAFSPAMRRKVGERLAGIRKESNGSFFSYVLANKR